jgi:hypothetical protein
VVGTISGVLEIALVLIGIATAGVTLLLSSVLTSALLTAVGLGVLLLGLALGLPTGFWYHVVLYRVVSAKAPVPRAWWLAPARLHRHLTVGEERRIAPWYRVGGAGFLLAVAGGLTAIASLLAHR